MAISGNKRITILNPSEIDQLYRLPRFTAAERTEYFTLTDEEEAVVARLRSLETKAYFILLLGYFRVKPVILQFRFREVRDDLPHIMAQYFPGSALPRGDLARNVKSTLYRKLLETVHFSSFTPLHKTALLQRLRDVATVCVDPRYLFDECLAYFSHERIALIRYTSLQTLVSLALRDERRRVEQIIKTQVKDSTKAQLRSLLITDGAISTLARLRKTAKDFSPAELHKELDNHHTIQEIYEELMKVVTRLKLSAGNLNYYASLVDYYNVSKLRRFDETKAFLYLVCYLTVRYRQINDNLAVAFRHLVRKHYEAAKANATERVTAELAIIQDKIKAAGQALHLFVEDALPNDLSFGQVRQQAFQLISPHEIAVVSTHIDQSGFDNREYEWQYIERHHQAGAQLRQFFLAMELNCQHIGVAFSKQVDTARSELAEFGILKTVDQRLISQRHKPYLCDAGTLQRRRVEFLLYRHIARHLQTGGITLRESERHRHLEDDLISVADWQHKHQWLAKSGLPRLAAPIAETLQMLQDTLETKIKHVCDRITAGENRYVVFADSGNTNLKWSIPHKKDTHAVNHPFFDQIIHMGIVDVMRFVHRKTDFLAAFSHIAGSQGEAPVRANDLLACIIANGTNFGLSKLANISDRSLGKLRAVHDNYIRLETLKEANDRVANAVTRLPIFRYYHVDRHQVFASIDGQKHECRINTFKARFSAKYFRQGKGVSAMTLVSNHIPLNTKIIGANEYEGHHVLDLLYNNSTDIKPDTISTDTHGTNRVNFALLDFFGYAFAPRYAKVRRVFEKFFVINPQAGVDKPFLQLKKPGNHALIIEEWDALQRILCSLNRKKISQSTIVQKLNNNKRSDKTLAALEEYDRLVKCCYLLDYVDDETLRGYVQKVLNRGEAYHQLRRAIAAVNGNRFIGGSDYHVELANECARLIANCIVYYNSAILSFLLARYERKHDQRAVEIITRVSPVAWQNVNLNGNYSFQQDNALLDLEALLTGVKAEER